MTGNMKIFKRQVNEVEGTTIDTLIHFNYHRRIRPTTTTEAYYLDKTTTSESESYLHKIKDEVTGPSIETPAPWALITIIIVACIVISGICFCCVQRWCRKRHGEDGKKSIDRKELVESNSAQILGSASKEKVEDSLE